MLEKMKNFRALARDNLAEAHVLQKHCQGKSRRHVKYTVGDLILLLNQNLGVPARSTLPRKWQPKYLGPLPVKQVFEPVQYRIDLPPSIRKAHDVVHASKQKEW